MTPGTTVRRRLVNRLLLFAGALLVAGALVPVDGVLASLIQGLEPHGDLEHELDSLQQFGQLGSIIVISLVVFLLDPRNRKRLVEWWLVAGVTAATCLALKIVFGRYRPRLEDHLTFIGPFQKLTRGLPRREWSQYTWELGTKRLSDLWSLPSSHTALAVVAAMFLISLYPRLKPLVLGLVVLVAFMRVAMRDHWPSDVIAGGAIGWFIGSLILDWCHTRRHRNQVDPIDATS